MYDILKDRSTIALFGSDSASFLGRLVTGDVTKAYSYNYLLSGTGRYLFDFFIFRESEERFLIDIDSKNSSLFLEKLNFYKLRSTLEIKDLSENYETIYSRGENLPFKTIFTQKDPRFYKLGYRSLSEKGNAPGAGEALYYRDKYNFAIPDGAEDLIYEKSIIVEYGANELGAVDHDKGCYLGQEVVARATNLGEIRKKVFKISSENDLSVFPKNSEIIGGEEKIGFLTSAFGKEAIAIIREEKFSGLKEPGVVFVKPTPDGPRVCAKAFVPEWR